MLSTQLNNRIIRQEMLRHPYIHVELEDGRLSYGGDQAWLSTAEERSFGCGLIAAADILRYLRAKEESLREEPLAGPDRDAVRNEAQNAGRNNNKLTQEEYLEDIRTLSRDFKIRGPLGITGFGLARRMNRIFRREKLPYRAKWSIGRRRFEKRLSEMLSRDIPVLLSVGPGFFHRNERLPMYHITDGFTKVNSMHDHYVTVTGCLELGAAGENSPAGKWLRISSWGGEYYVNYIEYMEHVRKYDNFLFSSLLYIDEKVYRSI